MPLDMAVGLVPGEFVLDRDPAPPPQKGGGGCSAPSPHFRMGTQLLLPHNFWAYVYSNQTVVWIKMKLCTEVRLGPGHIV